MTDNTTGGSVLDRLFNVDLSRGLVDELRVAQIPKTARDALKKTSEGESIAPKIPWLWIGLGAAGILLAYTLFKRRPAMAGVSA